MIKIKQFFIVTILLFLFCLGAVAFAGSTPYFSGATLPQTVMLGEKINFSGTVTDDRRIIKITMDVTDPNSTNHRVFSENLSVKSKSLSSYYFHSNLDYSGKTGRYYVTLFAKDDENNLVSQTFTVEVKAQSAPCLKPSTPNGLKANTTSKTSINISWNPVSGATVYKLYRDTSSSGSFEKQIYYASGTSYNDSGTHLQGGTRYYYKVLAENNCGQSAKSDFVSVVTPVAVTPSDNPPYFSNVSLPSEMFLDEKICFSGTCGDNEGLSVLSVLVSDPKGDSHSVYNSIPISGKSWNLSSYCFEGNNAKYSNNPGEYHVALWVKDTKGQPIEKVFSVKVKARPVTVVNDTPPYFGNISLSSELFLNEVICFSGMGYDKEGLAKLSVLVSGPKGNDIPVYNSVAIGGNSWNLSSYCFDGGSADYAGILGDYVVSLWIKDTKGQATNKVFPVKVKALPTDKPPSFTNVSLPSELFLGETIHFTGYLQDDHSLSKLVMMVSQVGKETNIIGRAINLNISSLDLAGIIFDSNASRYSGFAGDYYVTLWAKDDKGQETSSATFKVRVKEKLSIDKTDTIKPTLKISGIPNTLIVYIGDNFFFNIEAEDDEALSDLELIITDTYGQKRCCNETYKNIPGKQYSVSQRIFTDGWPVGKVDINITCHDQAGNETTIYNFFYTEIKPSAENPPTSFINQPVCKQVVNCDTSLASCVGPEVWKSNINIELEFQYQGARETIILEPSSVDGKTYTVKTAQGVTLLSDITYADGAPILFLEGLIEGVKFSLFQLPNDIKAFLDDPVEALKAQIVGTFFALEQYAETLHELTVNVGGELAYGYKWNYDIGFDGNFYTTFKEQLQGFKAIFKEQPELVQYYSGVVFGYVSSEIAISRYLKGKGKSYTSDGKIDILKIIPKCVPSKFVKFHKLASSQSGYKLQSSILRQFALTKDIEDAKDLNKISARAENFANQTGWPDWEEGSLVSTGYAVKQIGNLETDPLIRVFVDDGKATLENKAKGVWWARASEVKAKLDKKLEGKNLGALTDVQKKELVVEELSYIMGVNKPTHFVLAVINESTHSGIPIKFGKSASFPKQATGVSGQGGLTQYKIDKKLNGYEWEDILNFQKDGDQPKIYNIYDILDIKSMIGSGGEW